MNRNDLSTAEQIVADLAEGWTVHIPNDFWGTYACPCGIVGNLKQEVLARLDQHDPACPYRRAVEYMQGKEAQC